MMTKKRSLSMYARNQVTGYLFLLPWILGFLLFTLYPVIYSIQISFSSVKISGEGIDLAWRGFYYYNQALNVDNWFKINVGNTVFFMLCFTPVIVVLALIVSILLNKQFKGRTFFRVVYFVPVIIMSGPVISTLLTKYTVDFSDKVPQIYNFLSSLPSVLSDPALYILNNLVNILWFSGVQILIFLAGLQKINPNLYEAASIDGAGAWEKFWKITFPHMVPLTLIVSIYTLVDLANYENNAVNTQITKRIFDDAGRIYSLSSAMAWIFCIVVVVILLVVYLIFYMFGRGKSNGKA